MKMLLRLEGKAMFRSRCRKLRMWLSEFPAFQILYFTNASDSRQILVSNIHFSSFFFQKIFGYECGHSLKKEYNKDSSRIKEVTELSY